jgi:DNA-binding beta-propeller fold protein YncE
VTEVAGVRIGAEVSGYRVDELIGRGGMGEVYRAWDERLERNVALKILMPRLADDDAFRERLLRESRLAASLDHPNVVPVYDAGEADGRFFLAMRHVEGTDLRAVLRGEGALSPERAIDIAAQVAGALDAAHERGLVHRDVKPSNVLIDERGHCYLADFGLTQSLSSQAQAPDESLLGTLDYVAPEQIRGSDVDGRADVYSLGCLLFECLTGEVPFARPSEVATLYAHLEDEPPRPSERRPELPVDLDDVLGRAMAKDPDERQPSCTALVEVARVALGLVGTGPRRLRLAVAASAFVLLVAAAATAAILLTRASAPAQAGGSLIRIDPQSGNVTARYRVSAHPGVIVTSSGRVWLGDHRDGALWTLEPRTGELKRVNSLGEPRDLTALGGKIYVAADSAAIFAGTVTRYDAVTGMRERKLDLLACTIAGGEGVVWSCGNSKVNRLSTGSGELRVLRSLSLPYREPVSTGTFRLGHSDIAVGYGSVWVLGDALDRRLWRLDRVSGRVLATIELPFLPRTVAAGEGGVWISAPLDDRVLRIDPETNAIAAAIPTGRGTSGVAAGAGSVWVTGTLDGTVSRIDPRTGDVVDEIDVGSRPHEVAVGAGGVWVSADAR